MASTPTQLPSPLVGEGAHRADEGYLSALGAPSSGTARHLLPQGEKEGYFTGQSSAVMVAASAPTISESESRPVRSSVEERSFLMSSTKPSPL